MSAAFLKTIAVVAMIIDHLAFAFVETYSPLGQVMHGIGRITFPIMAYFIAEGFNKTSDIKAYIKRMAIFAIISHVPYRLLLFGSENLIGFQTSIIYTFLISLLILHVLEGKGYPTILKHIIVGILFILSSIGDYSLFGPLLVLAFHKGYGDRFMQITNGFIVILGLIVFNLVITDFESLYVIATIYPLILLFKYNGEKGHTIKYGFYILYPLQFIILSLLKLLTK